MRTLPQVKNPNAPKTIYSRQAALAATDVRLHELQDWTRKAKRGYFEPTQPASGQGTRQGFAFKDLIILRLIRLLKIANVRQHLISDIIALINKEDTQRNLKKYSQFNLLDESYLPRTKHLPDDLGTDSDIEYCEFRYQLKIGLTQDREPAERLELQLNRLSFKYDEFGYSQEIRDKRKNIWSVSGSVSRKFKRNNHTSNNKDEMSKGPPNRSAILSKIDLTYIHETIVHQLHNPKK